ncbi:MAG: hypothetical protein Q7V63_01045 [Gammaproteobacteria bacterium]|nr:hypothetical protein [Gammaproteobacteria bacterium]
MFATTEVKVTEENFPRLLKEELDKEIKFIGSFATHSFPDDIWGLDFTSEADTRLVYKRLKADLGDEEVDMCTPLKILLITPSARIIRILRNPIVASTAASRVTASDHISSHDNASYAAPVIGHSTGKVIVNGRSSSAIGGGLSGAVISTEQVREFYARRPVVAESARTAPTGRSTNAPMHSALNTSEASSSTTPSAPVDTSTNYPMHPASNAPEVSSDTEGDSKSSASSCRDIPTARPTPTAPCWSSASTRAFADARSSAIAVIARAENATALSLTETSNASARVSETGEISVYASGIAMATAGVRTGRTINNATVRAEDGGYAVGARVLPEEATAIRGSIISAANGSISAGVITPHR